jgi:hypothetical protein
MSLFSHFPVARVRSFLVHPSSAWHRELCLQLPMPASRSVEPFSLGVQINFDYLAALLRIG